MRRGAIILTASLVVAGSARARATQCWIDQGAIVAAASFGDIAGDFVIDAGAPISALHVTRANEDGVDADSATEPLVLAGRRLGKARLAVVDLDALPPTDTSIAGIIGADILARHPLTIAFAPCRLTWGAPPRLHVTAHLPLKAVTGAPSVEVVISDGAVTRRQTMVVSTGRAETRIAHAALSRAPNPQSTAPVRLRAVVIGGVLLEQVPAAVADAGPGALGTAAWRRWRMLRLDWKRRLLELGD